MLSTLLFVDGVADNFPAVDIEDEVQEQENAGDIGLEVRNVPAIDLVGASGN